MKVITGKFITEAGILKHIHRRGLTEEIRFKKSEKFTLKPLTNEIIEGQKYFPVEDMIKNICQ